MKKILATLAMAACFASTGLADVTGDFKVTGRGFANDVANVQGTVNHGAIQSKKTVAVDVTYEYSFAAEKVTSVPGTTSEVLIFVPGKCITDPVGNASSCFDKDGNPKAVNGAIWTGSYEISYITTEAQTITQEYNGSSGMTAITEPTIEKGRLNPKGKITGYNWISTLSIVPNDSIVDHTLIPVGYSLIPGSVVINKVEYAAYLKDTYGQAIADTVTGGIIFPADN